MKILLIDDDVDDQEIFVLALKSLYKSVDILTAQDGMEALEILKIFVPDCIFLDLNMPRMGGKECLAEMRKLPPLKNLPIVIYTTSSLDSDKRETKKLGASDYITKECDINLLKKSLSAFFNVHKF